MATIKAEVVPLRTWKEQSATQEGEECFSLTIASGRELARLGVEEASAEIRRRAAAGRLNRGLAIRLPYDDDAALALRHRDFTVVPRGECSSSRPLWSRPASGRSSLRVAAGG